MVGSGGSVEVRVPAHAESLRILRTVVASVGARHDLPLDAIEDLRIAVDEAATILLRSTTETRNLELRVDPDVRIAIKADGTAPRWPPDEANAAWPWIVITGLVEEAAYVYEDRPTITFRVRGPATRPKADP